MRSCLLARSIIWGFCLLTQNPRSSLWIVYAPRGLTDTTFNNTLQDEDGKATLNPLRAVKNAGKSLVLEYDKTGTPRVS